MVIPDAIIDLLAGTISGMAGKIIEYPFDTIKVRLQTDEVGKYKGAIDCAKQTVQSEGVKGMYRGVMSPIAGAMCENAVLFVVYGRTAAWIRENLCNEEQKKQAELPLEHLMLAGSVAGIAVSHVLTPVELVKCRLQVQEIGLSATKYKGALDCAIQVAKTEGISQGLFRGHASTLLREVPGNAAWFGAYEMFCRLFTPAGKTKDDLPGVALMAAGAAGGCAYWTAFFPADVVKSQQQTSKEVQSFGQVFKSIYKSQGIGGLYKGWGVTMCRAVPANAAIFGAYEVVKRELQTMNG